MAQSIDDPTFGHLIWDGRQHGWVGSAEVPLGHLVEVFIAFEPVDTRPHETAEFVLGIARRNLARLREYEAEYRRWSAERMLTTRWNDDEPMTADEINELLCVASVTFWHSGITTIYWDDHDRLFGGHNVITELGSDGACILAGME